MNRADLIEILKDTARADYGTQADAIIERFRLETPTPTQAMTPDGLPDRRLRRLGRVFARNMSASPFERAKGTSSAETSMTTPTRDELAAILPYGATAHQVADVVLPLLVERDNEIESLQTLFRNASADRDDHIVEGKIARAEIERLKAVIGDLHIRIENMR